MPTFHYTAKDNSGATKQGSVEAIDQNDAHSKITAAGLYPTALQEAVQGAKGSAAGKLDVLSVVYCAEQRGKNPSAGNEPASNARSSGVRARHHFAGTTRQQQLCLRVERCRARRGERLGA